jgi:hypothetical protein
VKAAFCRGFPLINKDVAVWVVPVSGKTGRMQV